MSGSDSSSLSDPPSSFTEEDLDFSNFLNPSPDLRIKQENHENHEKRVIDKVKKWCQTDKHQKVLVSLEKERITKLLWIRPSSQLISAIIAELGQTEAKGIFSIGCGTGILEWLVLKNAPSLEVKASEREYVLKNGNQRDWDVSLIEIHFTDTQISVPIDFALFQCYGHDESVFDSYFNVYQGDVVILIGHNGYSFPPPSFMMTKVGWTTKKLEVPHCEVYFSTRD